MATAIPIPTRTRTYTRQANGKLELPFEKPVVVPNREEQDPAVHAWADARFWAEIMSEHALFFALLMPEELAARERAEALAFSQSFADLHGRIDSDGTPRRTDVASFSRAVNEQVKPFIEFKARLGDAQRSGQLRSLVWPLFFDHTREEAERFSRRLEALANGETEYERSEVVAFWADIMEQHARFIAHLLDPDELELVETATNMSHVFRELRRGGTGAALVAEPATLVQSVLETGETDAVLSAASSILEFKTEAARGIEAARIKSIIDPRLADHVRREALKFIDELKRAV
jgi:hypothetical protein